MTRGVISFACSDGANARGLGALGALSDLELDLLVLLKGAEAAPLNFRVVDKHIGGAVLGSDKAEALLRVEPLHSSLWHLSYFPSLLPGTAHRLPVHRARSDRHTFVVSPELDPT